MNCPVQGQKDTSRDRLERALQLHRAGELDAAEAAYRDLLAAEPANADAAHLLGLVADARGDTSKALEYMQRATAARRSPRHLANLAMVLGKLGRFVEAIPIYQNALELLPDYPEALNNLGVALDAVGRVDE